MAIIGGEENLNYAGVLNILSTAAKWILIVVSATEFLSSSSFA